jgi:hypothetical protein
MNLEALRDIFSDMKEFIENSNTSDISIFAITNPSINYTNKENIKGRFGWKLIYLHKTRKVEKEFISNGYIKANKNDYFIDTIKYFLLDPETLLSLLKNSIEIIGENKKIRFSDEELLDNALKLVGDSKEDLFRKELLLLARIDHLDIEN